MGKVCRCVEDLVFSYEFVKTADLSNRSEVSSERKDRVKSVQLELLTRAGFPSLIFVSIKMCKNRRC